MDDPARSAQRRRLPTGVIARTRYVVGIDLGTTNTAVAWIDRRSGTLARAVRPFDVPQLVEPGVVAARRTLPSAVYVRGGHELSAEQVALPWDAPGGGAGPLVVGALARARGALVPDRLVTSAKSWLCHPGVDRAAAILPWGAGDDVPRRSPVDVEAALLAHVREAWDHLVARDDDAKRLARADVVVTLPASFDEIARELTVAAIGRAGLEDAVLIEEPQAALYAWIARHEATWTERLRPGETVLVCDVGGGTTDFSLIRVTPAAGDDGPGFERVAVGEHLLLGGDNMDLALARRVEERLGRQLDARAWSGLVQACREAKERLLEPGAPGPDGQVAAPPERAKVAIAGRGSRLVGGTLEVELTRAEVADAIVEGFFPLVPRDEPPLKRRGALKELGLPYEAEPAITRHLRRFLGRHGPERGALARVDHVLFNGGVFRTAALRARVLDALGQWQGRPGELEGADLDLAVAQGAAYYGLVRRGKGTRIKSGAGRSYYVEVGGAPGRARRALCLVPRGLDEGAVVTIDRHPLEVRANTPVVFPFHTATAREDAPGALVELDPEEHEELAPLHTVIRVGKKRTQRLRTLPVELVARYTELGTLEIWLQEKPGAQGPGQAGAPGEGGERRWRLELDTRPAERRGEGSDEAAALPAGPAPAPATGPAPAPATGPAPAPGQAAGLAPATAPGPGRPSAGPEGAAAPGGPAAPGADAAAPAGPQAALPPDEELPPAGPVTQASDASAAQLAADPARVDRARKLLVTALRRPPAEATRGLEGLAKDLEEALGLARDAWPVPVIRTLFDVLTEEAHARRRSALHEARWLNLAGFCLRPGFGAARDVERANLLWRMTVQEGLAHDNRDAVVLEHLVALRRASGGLHRGQQETLWNRLSPQLLGQKRVGSKQELAELWRLAACLEHLPAKRKRQLGDHMLEQLAKGKAPPRWGPWAIGRLGARAPLYGPLDRLVTADAAGAWLARLLELGLSGAEGSFAVVQLARRTGDRARDVDDALRARARAWLAERGADRRTLRPLDEVVVVEARTETELYGDSVPMGLVLAD